MKQTTIQSLRFNAASKIVESPFKEPIYSHGIWKDSKCLHTNRTPWLTFVGMKFQVGQYAHDPNVQQAKRRRTRPVEGLWPLLWGSHNQ